MTLRLATWNINSIRIRVPLLKRLAEEYAPDVLCLQETKTPDDAFPFEEARALGFPHIAIRGEKGYNGVAILSKRLLGEVESLDILGNGSTRHISARLPNGTRLHNFYVPAGGDVPDPDSNPKFEEKLRFMTRMWEWSEGVSKDENTIIAGDFNIAPYEHDVWSHKQLLAVVSHTPVEVEAMSRLRESAGWIDTAREFVPMEEKLYSWWSYRNRDWRASNRGRRLDHIWITPGLRPLLAAAETVSAARGWDNPSDHVPVIATLNV